MNGMTDVHQHLLWGLDDGPDKPETTFEMLHEAHRQGIRRVIATPHANPGIEPVDLEKYFRHLEQTQRYCVDAGLDVTILPGAEIAWNYNTVSALRRGLVPTLAATDYVLIELWPTVTWQQVRSISEELLRAGYTPLFAHVERYHCFVWQPEKAIDFREEMPVRYQLNASTVLGSGGMWMKRFVRRLLDARCFDAVASDAHDCHYRPQRLRDAYETLLERCPADYAWALVNFEGVQG